MLTDTSGDYSALWCPYHYIGLELAQSIYSIALEKKATGQTKFFNADVASIAKKNIRPGEILDGEGGFFARGRLVSAKKSITEKLLPLGLSGGSVVVKNIKKDDPIKLSDVLINWNPFVKEARDYQRKLAS